jgi:hypothetical protein
MGPNLALVVVVVLADAADDDVAVGQHAAGLLVLIHDRDHAHALLLHDLGSLKHGVILLEAVRILGDDLCSATTARVSQEE